MYGVPGVSMKPEWGAGQKTGRQAHEPLSSSTMPANVLAEVPLTGLSFEIPAVNDGFTPRLV